MGSDAALMEPQLRGLLAFWAERCSEGELPAKRTLDPVKLFKLLPYLILVEVTRGGADFRIRLAGCEVENRYGRCLRGLSIYDLSLGSDTEGVDAQWRDTQRTSRPRYGRGPLRLCDRRHYRFSRLIVPIAGNDGPRNRAAFLLAGALLYPLTSKQFERCETITIELDAARVAAVLNGNL